MQQLVSPNIEENLSGVKYFVDLMVYKKLSDDLRSNSIMLNMLTPPYVRKAMLGYPKDNSDLIKEIKVPVLISHGVEDMIVDYLDVVKVAEVLPNSTLSTYKKIGHAPFMEEPMRFNKELSSFTLRSIK
jgi:pimeloyl-ACP methyl ester carboxylesterase